MVGCLTLAHMAYEEAGGRGAGAGAPTATATVAGGTCSAKKAENSCYPSGVSVALHIAAAAAVVGLGALAVVKASKN